MHSVWIAIVVPILFLIPWAHSGSRRRIIWIGTGLIGVLGLIAWIAFDVTSFLSTGGSQDEAVLRGFYAIIAQTDIPLVALIVASVINGLFWPRYRQSAHSQSISDDSASTESGNDKLVPANSA